MTYSAGNLIVATDYNGFANNTSDGNVNYVWGTGSGDYGYGQSTTLSTVSSSTSITATQWSSLNSRVTSLGSQTNTTLTSRTNPTTGTLISILANIGTNITSCVTNRGNAQFSGTTSSTWSGTSFATGTGNIIGTGTAAWTITFTHTVDFGTADQARYFWNAGGLVRLDMSKTSTGTDSDPDWNAFIANVGTLYLSGRVASSNQTIAGATYTGFTRVGGSGTPSPNLTTTGWYSLTAGAAATSMWTLTNAVSPYTGDYVNIIAARNSTSTILTLVTSWYSAARPAAGQNTQITGGSATNSPFTTFGTAPAVICRYVPPSTNYLTSTWGTPTVVAASVVT